MEIWRVVFGLLRMMVRGSFDWAVIRYGRAVWVRPRLEKRLDRLRRTKAARPDLASLCSRMLRRDFLARGKLLINGIDAGYRLVCDGWAVSGLIGLDLPPNGAGRLNEIFDQVAGFARNALHTRLDPTWRSHRRRSGECR